MENTVNFEENAFKLTETSIHCHKLFISIKTSQFRGKTLKKTYGTHV